MNFTLIDYTAFGLWILISIFISYIIIDKLKFFKGDKIVKKVMACGLILGHLLYLIWKYMFLKIIGS